MADRTYYQSNELIPRGARVVISGGKLSLAGASEEGYGTCGRPCPVGAASQVDDFDSDDGAFCRCDTFIAAGATVYAAAGGLVDTVGSVAIGTAKADSAGGLVAVKLTFGKYSVSTQHSEKLAEAGLSPTSVSPSDVTALGTRLSAAESAISALQSNTANSAYVPKQGTINGTVLDLTSGDFFKITLSANGTYSVANAGGMTEGQFRYVYVNNGGSWTFSLSGIAWDGTAPTIPTSKMSRIQLQKLFGVLTGKLIDSTGYSIDVTAPTVSSAAISSDGLTLTVTFSESVTATDWTGLTIAATGGAGSPPAPTLAYVGGDGTSIITYSISRAIQQAETVTRTYSGTAIKDLAGNALSTFSVQSVTNGSSYVLTALAYSESFDGTMGTGWTKSASSVWNDSGDLTCPSGQYATFVDPASYIPADTAISASTSVLYFLGSARATVAPTADHDVLMMRNTAGSGQALVRIGTDFEVKLTNNSGTLGTLRSGASKFYTSLNTDFYYWVLKGSDLKYYLYVSATSTFPGVGNYIYSTTLSNSGDTHAFRMGNNSGGATIKHHGIAIQTAGTPS